MDTLSALSAVYTPGDTDLAWAGVTLWRALLAAVAEDFDRLPTSIRVAGNATHPSPFLVAAWLHHQLGVPVERVVDPEALTITDITFFFDDDTTVSLSRSATSSVARLSRPGLEDRTVNLARRSVQDSLMEDLRRLDPDVYYGELLTKELPRLAAVLERRVTMVGVHTLEVYPTVEALNEAVGPCVPRASAARSSTRPEAASRINLAISGGAITTSLLPSLLPRVGDVDWSRVRVWLVDERYVPAGRRGSQRRSSVGGLPPRGHRRRVRPYADLR